MILDIDIGNTFLKWRCSGARQVDLRGRMLTQQLDDGLPAAWPGEVSGVRVGCVAGVAAQERIRQYSLARWGLEPEFARVQHEAAGVRNSYADPARMGVDRWLAMLAAYNQAQGAVCVVDCGSAITIDFVEAGGQHQGGYIVPGMRLMAQSLLSNTAQVRVDPSIGAFNTAPGTHTSAAVCQGINFVFDAIQHRLLEQLDHDYPDALLFITGGDGELFARLAGRGEHVPDLVLDGLHWALS